MDNILSLTPCVVVVKSVRDKPFAKYKHNAGCVFSLGIRNKKTVGRCPPWFCSEIVSENIFACLLTTQDQLTVLLESID